MILRLMFNTFFCNLTMKVNVQWVPCMRTYVRRMCDVCTVYWTCHVRATNILSAHIIALSHIHVSAAYRSRIYQNIDTPRSEPYFARATYVPRTCDVPATFP